MIYNNRIRVALSSLCLLLALGLPSGLNAIFDGLPWVHRIETITILIIIPSLLFLGWKFLALKPVTLCLSLLLLIKVILLVSAPSFGWIVRVYPTTIDSLNERWVTTYDTLWHSEASGVLTRPWTDYRDFPMSWAVTKLTTTSEWGKRHKELDITHPRDVKPWIGISGSVQIPPGHDLILVTDGITEGTLGAFSATDKHKIIPIINKTADTLPKFEPFPIGEDTWRVEGRIHLGEDDWTIIPILRNSDGVQIDVFWQDVLFQSRSQE